MSRKKTNWVISPPRKDAKFRLFCLPFAGGAAVVFHNWTTFFPDGIDVCAVQLPGRDGRIMEPFVDNMAELVPALYEGLKEYMDIPFAILGYSMGGIITYELARHIRRNNLEVPAHLFLNAVRSPTCGRFYEQNHLLDDEALLEKIRTQGGTPKSLLEQKEIMEMLLPRIRADYKLVETYVYAEEQPLEIPATVIGGSIDTMAMPAEVEDWKNHFNQGFDLHMVEGGEHFFLQSHSEIMFGILSKALEKILAEQNT